MPTDALPPEIESGLISLRRRIRRIQWVRGLLKIATILFGGLLLIAALDFLLAPLPVIVRAVLFFGWLAALVVGSIFFLLRPLTRKLTLLKLARWLEKRHPEVQERISTALELSSNPVGISQSLLADLSAEAATDISTVDPRDEVRTRRIRRSLWPAAVALLALILLLVIWPRQMSRLLARAVSPFSTLGNAGAFRFQIDPGDLEVIEGDEFTIDLTYTGSLDQPLQLLVEKNGEILTESLRPASSDGDVHTYQYTVHSAQEPFRYSARVGPAESDRFAITVHPTPRLLDPVVHFRYPAYTAWPDRKTSLGAGISVLAGTEVTLTGRLDTPVKEGLLLYLAKPLGEVTLDPSANGTTLSWTQTLAPKTNGSAELIVTHRLGRDLPGAQFRLEATEDLAPVVEILTPVQREFRVKPDDQIILTYSVTEAIGLSKAEIELEVNGRPVEPLLELLPERVEGPRPDLWQGEAMIYLGSLIPRFQGANKFRMRLALSDNRPADLEGPGVGHSEWLEVTLDQNAESLVRQELRKQDKDFHRSLQDAIRDLNDARNQMNQARHELNKEEISERAEQALTTSSEKLQKAREDLAELTERMKQSVQAHRRDDLEAVMEKIAQAEKSVEATPLQDTPESWHSELDNALAESQQAIDDLRALGKEAHKDRPKIDDLARLQELAQKQEQLAREAAKTAENPTEKPDEEWLKEQRRMENQLREHVRQSPEAQAAALKAQAEKAEALAAEAAELQSSQKQLSDLAKSAPKDLTAALAREQASLMNEAAAQLEQQKNQPDQAVSESLPEAVKAAESAAAKLSESKPAEAASAAKEASEKLATDSEKFPEQKPLQQRQEKLSKAIESLAAGDESAAREALAELQAERVAQALAKEQESVVEGTREELATASAAREERANDLPEAVAQAEAASEAAQSSNAEKAAAAAQKASQELSKGSEKSPSQEALQQKQEQLAEAFAALAEGKTSAALASLEEMQAARARSLADEIREFPQHERNELAHARSTSRAGAQKASRAAKSQSSGKSERASQQHQQSSEDFSQTAQALKQASQNFSMRAEEAAGQEESNRQAPAPGNDLAEAFEESAEAANAANNSEAAQKSEAASKALNQAAKQARVAMSRGRKSSEPMAQNEGTPPEPGEGNKEGQGNQAGDKPTNEMRENQDGQGVPPELAKLGISTGDWEKIKATLKSDLASSQGGVIPEDYRSLVKKYFEQVTREE